MYEKKEQLFIHVSKDLNFQTTKWCTFIQHTSKMALWCAIQSQTLASIKANRKHISAKEKKKKKRKINKPLNPKPNSFTEKVDGGGIKQNLHYLRKKREQEVSDAYRRS